MNALRWALLLLAIASAATAAEIRSYSVTVVAADNGTSRGTASLVLDAAGASTVTVPLGVDRPANLRLTAAPAQTRLSAEPFDGQTRLRIDFAAPPRGETRLDLAFDFSGAFTIPVPPAGQSRVLPKGASLFTHRLVNTEQAVIRSYRFDVELPPRLRVRSVVQELPPQGIQEAEPRVTLIRAASAPGASLRTGELRQGDTAAMKLEVVPARRSPLWLAAGLILSVAYLVYFRDLVASPHPKPGEPK